MSPSRPFILRPVATSLLMLAILLAGIIAYRLLPISALPRGRLPDDPGGEPLPGREPGRHDLVDHRAARAPVRADARAQADVVDELRRGFGHHAAIRPHPVARRRGTGSAGGDQRLGQFSAGRPAHAADLQQGQSGGHADHDAGADVANAAAAADRGYTPTRVSRPSSRSFPASGWSASAAASAPRCASRPIRPRSRRTGCRWTTCAPRSAMPTPTRPRAASTARRGPRRSTPTISSRAPPITRT